MMNLSYWSWGATVPVWTLAVALWGTCQGYAPGEENRKQPPQQDRSEDYDAGLSEAEGRAAWHDAAESHLFLRLHKQGRHKELEELYVEGMWFSLVELDQFVQNENVDQVEREAAGRVLERIVKYFEENPRKVELEKVELSQEFSDRVDELVESKDFDPSDSDAMESIASQAKATVGEVESFLNKLGLQRYIRDRMSEKVFERLSER